jgi:hypothetical protein
MSVKKQKFIHKAAIKFIFMVFLKEASLASFKTFKNHVAK